MKKIVVFLLFALLVLIAIITRTPEEVISEVTSPVSQTVLSNDIISPQNKILFVSDRNGNRDIYLMDLITKKQTALTTDASDEMNPQVSPDGSSIVYYSNLDGDNEIYEMDLTTRQVRKMTDNEDDDYDPSYSFDGLSLIFKSDRDDGKGDIFIMQRDGTAVRNITSERPTTEEWDPVFSPDGSIFFVVRRGIDHTLDEIYRKADEASKPEQITDNTFADWYPEISGSGRELLYISKAKASLDDDLYLMNLITMKPSRLTYQEGNDADPSFDHLGKKVIFINDKDGDYDLYIMNVDGTGIEKILNTDDEELSPIFL